MASQKGSCKTKLVIIKAVVDARIVTEGTKQSEKQEARDE